MDTRESVDMGAIEFNTYSQEYEITDDWLKSRILENGYLSDNDTKSEYERGFIDCWNELRRLLPKHIRIRSVYIK